jgi:hypothetical protein
MMSPLLIEQLAECIHAERQADSNARRVQQQFSPNAADATPRPWRRYATVGTALTCLAAVSAALIGAGGLPHQF